MPGPWEGWLYLISPDGTARELINHARTASYLQNAELPNGMLLCNVLDFGGCEAYAYDPPCSSAGAYIDFPTTINGLNVLTMPDETALGAPTQLDIRVTLGAMTAVASTRAIVTQKAFGSGQHAFNLRTDTTGKLVLLTSTNGTSFTTATCDEVLTASDNPIHARVTWRSSDGRVQFFSKTVGDLSTLDAELDADTGWTQRGADEVGVTAALHNSTATLNIGADNGSSSSDLFKGHIYGFSLATTIDGAAVVRILNTDIPPEQLAATLSASTGQTFTVARGGSGGVIGFTIPSSWEPLVFFGPSFDDAPWYNEDQPESADALGFFIDEWTGLGNEHVSRHIAPKGGWGGGAQLGPLSAGARTMAFGVQMFATSVEGMEYLFRWLEQTLYSVCDTCSTDSILIRRFCPSGDDLWSGVVRMNNVGLSAGPNWENELLQINKCYHRRVSFVLTVGDPCMYLPGTDYEFEDTANLTQCFGDVFVDPDRNPCRPECIELSANNADCRQRLTIDVGPVEAAVAPVVTLENTTTEYSVPTRVLVYYDPAGISPTNPCSLQLLGELYVRPIRPGATLKWDVAAREVMYRDHTTGLFVPGWAYIDPNDPPVRRWFTLPCGQVDVVLEPSTLCLTDQGGGIYDDGVHTFNDPAFPSPSVELVPRIGCP